MAPPPDIDRIRSEMSMVLGNAKGAAESAERMVRAGKEHSVRMWLCDASESVAYVHGVATGAHFAGAMDEKTADEVGDGIDSIDLGLAERNFPTVYRDIDEMLQLVGEWSPRANPEEEIYTLPLGREDLEIVAAAMEGELDAQRDIMTDEDIEDVERTIAKVEQTAAGEDVAFTHQQLKDIEFAVKEQIADAEGMGREAEALKGAAGKMGLVWWVHGNPRRAELPPGVRLVPADLRDPVVRDGVPTGYFVTHSGYEVWADDDFLGYVYALHAGRGWARRNDTWGWYGEHATRIEAVEALVRVARQPGSKMRANAVAPAVAMSAMEQQILRVFDATDRDYHEARVAPEEAADRIARAVDGELRRWEGIPEWYRSASERNLMRVMREVLAWREAAGWPLPERASKMHRLVCDALHEYGLREHGKVMGMNPRRRRSQAEAAVAPRDLDEAMRLAGETGKVADFTARGVIVDVRDSSGDVAKPVKAVLDNGTGAIIFTLPRDAARAVTGLTAEQEAAMPRDELRERIETAVLGRAVELRGDIESDPYGFIFRGREARFLSPAEPAMAANPREADA